MVIAAAEPIALGDTASRLAAGLDAIDADVVATFSEVVPEGRYLPLLLEVSPRLVRPVSGPEDYFAEEQVVTWGLSGFWGLPENPQTPYYRTFDTRVDDDAHLHEFVVPMVPPSWNDRLRVAAFRELLAAPDGPLPTAVALTTLDVCGPAVAAGRADWHVHWGLTHFLLDGHHKLEAAASVDGTVRLLSLLTLNDSLATEEELALLPALRAREQLARRPPRV